jgi:exodeoxyribonuclease VII small subunit
MPRKTKQTFESAMQELEEMIKALEEGKLTLEESITSYQKGMSLAVYCQEMLQKAEQEIYVYEENGFKKSGEDQKDEA